MSFDDDDDALPTAPRAVHLLIHGRVQGVGYRAWLAEEATRFGLAGWARNLLSGEVEAVLYGPENVVEAIVVACRTGPLGARVDGIVESETAERPTGFRVRGTA